MIYEFHQYEPIRQGSHPNPYVRDVESHLTLQGYNYYRVPDSLTSTVHECSHGINADLRNRISQNPMVNCMYLLDNNYFVAPEPNWRKREVIPYIPDKYKTSTLYTQYVSRPNWDERPLYIWDEWVCYVNGSMLGEAYSLRNALIMGIYAGAVLLKEFTFGLWGFYDYLCFKLEPLITDPQMKTIYSDLRNLLE